jgi:hypothetical protein
MPIQSPAEWELMLEALRAIQAAPHGQKARIVQATCAALQISPPTFYRRLEQAGLDTGRKTRSDAGTTQMPLPELRLVSGLLMASRRDNDKQLLTVQDALDMLRANGQVQTTLTAGRVGQLLREHHLHPDQLAQQEPATEMRSLHPNHVWQIDASVCVLYYLKSGQLQAMDRDEFYRNKPQNLARVAADLCNRYTVSDHYSGAFKCRYLLGGESAANLVEFFIWAVSKQRASPMHGAPAIVMLDPGAANKGHLFANLTRRMGVRLVINQVGNARAKGQVEKTHDLIERHFEGRFRFFEADQLTHEGINDAAEQWAAAYCSHRKHSRHGQTRYGLWMTIAPGQLRVPESEEVLRELVTSEPVERRVSNTMQVSFSPRKGAGNGGARDYDVSRVPGAVVGGKVLVAINAYRAPAIDVGYRDADTRELCWMTVAPIERNDAGFMQGAPVIGEEPRTAAHTVVDHERTRLLREAYRAPNTRELPSLEDAKKARKRHDQAYAGVVDAMADVRATPVPAYLPRRGVSLETGARREVSDATLSVVEACKRLRAVLGDDYGPHVYEWVSAKFAEGVPELQVQALAEQFARRDEGDGAGEGGLRAVGGGAQ